VAVPEEHMSYLSGAENPLPRPHRYALHNAVGVPNTFMAMVIGEVGVMNPHGTCSRLFRRWFSAAAHAACGAICMLAVLACGGDSDSTAAWDGIVRDSAGIEIVENFGAPLWPEGLDWEFTEVLRIGASHGAPEYQFGRISNYQVLSDGRIVVLDGMERHLRFFSSDGRYERTVGREGQGPGEFGSGAVWLNLGPGDTLVVLDRANRRGNVIAPDGTWLESFSTEPRAGYYNFGWRSSSATGRLMSTHSPIPQSDGTLSDTLDIMLARGVHGAILDTLARVPSWLTFVSAEDRAVPHHYFVFWGRYLCDDDLVIARRDQYRFRWHDAGGTLKRIITLARVPLAMTDEDRSVFIRRWDEYLQDNGVPAERAAEIKSSVRFADTYSAFTRFTCGPAGTLLVQRVRPVRDLDVQEQKEIPLGSFSVPPGSLEWDVFDRAGRYLGVVVIPGTELVAVPPRCRFLQDRATGSWYMYSTWSDEMGVQYVVRWRVDGRMPE
jgi:hypothetical protein